jgi:hypothetical protein
MMARCGCDAVCTCFLEGTGEATVTGAGTELNPYIIDVPTPTPPAADQDLATFTRTDVLTVGTGVVRFRFPFAVTILGVSAAVDTAPTGSSIILDVNRNGTTIFTTQANRPEITIGAFDSGAEDVPDVTAVAAGQYLTVDRDQVGSTIAGAELTVFVRYSTP